MSLQLQLFGRLRITHAGTGFAHLLRPRSQRLLGYLLLHRRGPVSREKIAFTLWTDSPETTALGNLRRALHGLHAVLPKEHQWIIASRGELRWNPNAPYRLDVEEYERLIRQATPATLHDAVALYTGDLLPELDDEWVVIERERLRQIQHDLLGQIVAHHRALGEYEIALELARRRLVLEPLAESAHRDLMALHYLAGDRAAAIAAYDRLRITLRDELNVEPMAETRSLLEVIVQGARLPLPKVSPLGPTLVSPPTPAVPRLIGREAEMTELGALWERAAAGRGRLAMVSGRAGIGKTHLVLNLAEYVAKRGGLALVGHCYEFERALPYQAIVEMLRAATNLLRHIALPPAHRAALARVAPDVLGAAGSPEADEAASAGASQAQLFEALLQAFLALARSQPALLLIEDMHWASESTLDWLTYVVPRLAASRMLVAITYRTEEVGTGHPLARLGRRFAREDAVSTLSLGPLSREANRELVAQISGLADELAVPIADRLFVETAGNPFFLREMVRGLIEARQIVVVSGRWTGPFLKAAPDVRVPLPDSLRETINARVERLTDSSRELIRGAAAVGRVFEYAVVQQAGDWTSEMALAALEDLLARDFICPEQTEGPALSAASLMAEGTFAFVHHLVQEAIYAEMTAPRQSYYHQRIGAAIEQLYPQDEGRLGDLAYHHFHGQAWEKAAEYNERAARQAEAHYADVEAIHYYDQALNALDRLPAADPQRRFALLSCRLRAEERQGDYERMTATLAEMEDVARASGDDAILAGALLSRGHFLRMVGPFPEALIVLEECVRLSENLGRSDFLASALVDRAWVHLAQLRDRDAVADLQRALTICQEGDFPSDVERQVQRAVALRSVGGIYNRLGRCQAALDAMNEGLALLHALPNPRLDEIALTRLEMGWMLVAMGGVQRGQRLLAETLESLHKIDLRGVMAEARLLEMISRIMTGKQPLLLAETREAAYELEQAGRWQSRPDIRGQRLALLAYQELWAGRPDLALPDAQLAIAQWRQIGDSHNILLATMMLTSIHLALDQVEAALDVSAQGLDMLGEMESYARAHIYFARYWALTATGRLDEAQPYLEQAGEMLSARLDALREPNLRQETYSMRANAEIITAWKKAQGV